MFVVGAVGDHAHPALVGEHVHLPAVAAAEHPHPVYHAVYPQYQQYYHPQPQLRSVHTAQ